jgi:hypothetical protein
MSVRRVLGLVVIVLLGAAPLGAAAQDPERVTAIARGAEIAVQTIREGCTLDLSAQSVLSPGGGSTTQLRYRRQGGCRSIAWEREAPAVAQLLDALMPRIAGKPRPSALHWGRIEQPALQARFAVASLAADVVRLDESPELYRRTVDAINASEVFAELRRAFAAHGLSLSARGIEKLERARPTELGRWGVDRNALGQRLTQDMRIPVAAQLWFALAPSTP